MSNDEDENILNICKSCIKEWSDYLAKNPYDDFRHGMPERFQLAEILLSQLMRIDNGDIPKKPVDQSGRSN